MYNANGILGSRCTVEPKEEHPVGLPEDFPVLVDSLVLVVSLVPVDQAVQLVMMMDQQLKRLIRQLFFPPYDTRFLVHDF